MVTHIDSPALALPTPGPDDEVFVFPASSAQRRLWFLDQWEPGTAVYNIPFAVRLTGPLDPAALEGALVALAERHETLRTTFTLVEGRPMQVVAPQPALTLDRCDLQTTPDREAAAQQHVATEIRRPFNLAQRPLLRALLLQLAPQEHILVLTLHHIIADGWSLSVLCRELGALYAAPGPERDRALPPLPIQYADFTLWQDEWLHSKPMAAQLAYWQQHLAAAPGGVDLPTDYPRPATQSYRGAILHRVLPPALAAALHQLSRREGATLYMTLLAALQVLLARMSAAPDLVIGTPIAGRIRPEVEDLIGCFLNMLALRTDLRGNPTFRALLAQVRETTLAAYAHQDLPFEQLVDALPVARDPSRPPVFNVLFNLLNTPPEDLALPGVEVTPLDLEIETAKFDLSVVVQETADGLVVEAEYASDLFAADTIARLLDRYTTLLAAVVAAPDTPVMALPLLPPAEQAAVLTTWNATSTAYPTDTCIHDLIAAQARQTPTARAVVFGATMLTYEEMDARANVLAHRLRAAGAGPEIPIGLCAERSLEMVIGMLAILKAGSAYVPLDPAYPAARLAYMLADSGAPLVLTQAALADRLPAVPRLLLDGCANLDAGQHLLDPPVSAATAGNLAYIIYTSGSTGQPKGTMIPHRAVINFFAGMDARVGISTADTLLALTSISFDISVLELLWPLARGAAVVILADETIREAGAMTAPPRPVAPMQFSLFYFANDTPGVAADSYRLVLDGARYADQHGFTAVWTPERHFHPFGGLYPNPSVMSAALAACTQRLQIRAGSVVLPLHNPIRVAEEWALVDNLSGGRVGIAFASGWHANDFVFFPDHYAPRREVLAAGISTVQRLWRGEAIAVRSGSGEEIEVRTFPRPVQPTLPTWITAAGSPDTFAQAGILGANVLTHLLGQTVEDLAAKIRIYREHRAQAGHDPQTGQVTLMLHTFVGDDLEAVRDLVRAPFTSYLRSSVGLLSTMIKSLDLPYDMQAMSDQEWDTVLAFAFERYFETSALFGTPEHCQVLVERLQAIGVDEIACLIDFGVAPDTVLAHLDHLGRLKERVNQPPAASLAAQAMQQGATLLQATPSLLRLLLIGPGVGALAGLRALLLGGEALPGDLLAQVQAALPRPQIHNMYGPTETTIWSATHAATPADGETAIVPIGQPTANTQVYVLDAWMQPMPVGVAGELHIGGAGVARGYLGRPALTAARFVPDPFSATPGARLYRTGDRARWRPDGTLAFLGRGDSQVKIRGHRIEPAEIEATLARHPAVAAAVVVARTDSAGPARLVAYLIPAGATGSDPAAAVLLNPELRAHLQASLPDYMVPAAFVWLEAFPQTPNGKIDRQRLPAPETLAAPLAAEAGAPRTPVEATLVGIWAAVLRHKALGIHDNFFSAGGDSILAIQAIARAHQTGIHYTPRQLFKHQTIAELAAVVSVAQPVGPAQEPVRGPVLLTPIQHWFLDQPATDLHHYNQAFLLALHERPNPAGLEAALRHLAVHHDTLRLRFRPTPAGWEQTNAGPEAAIGFALVDLAERPAAEHGPAIEAAAAAWQTRFDLAAGPLMQAVLFDCGAAHPTRLLLVIHHLAVDGISWRILLDDLQTAYRQIAAGTPPRLPAKTTAFRDWARHLHDYAATPALRQELATWLDLIPPAAAPLPRDYPRGANEVGATATIRVELSADETHQLVQDLPALYNTRIDDALLLAVAQAFHRWTGAPDLLIDLEGHGREDLFTDVDLSRTVGWFTTLFPVRLTVRAGDAPGTTFKAIKEQLRRIPQRGLGYGVLRYLHPDPAVRAQLAARPQAEVIFNYLGQFDQVFADGGWATLAAEERGPEHSPRRARPHLLEINGLIVEGRLAMDWTYNPHLHRPTTVAALAEDFLAALRALLAECQSPTAGGFTPSDFPEAGLSQDDLDSLIAELTQEPR